MANFPKRKEYQETVAADWASLNPTLMSGDLAVESDTGSIKVGDGSTAYNGLSSTPGAASSILVFDAGASAATARPIHSGIVYWINSPTEPTNALAGDLWFAAD